MSLERYGLSEDPFEPHRELDPTSNPNDSIIIANTLSERDRECIESVFRKTSSPNKPYIFLIYGDRGTGRTSIARYILFKYSEFLKNKDSAHELIHTEETSNDENIFGLAFDIVDDLKWRVRRRARNAGDDQEARAIASEIDVYFDNPGNDKQRTVSKRANGFIRELSDLIAEAKPSASLGVIIENVDSEQKLKFGLELFRRCQGIVVMTVLEHKIAQSEVILPFREKGTPISLPLYGPDEIMRLINNRWTGKSPPPFKESAVKQAFSDRNRSLLRVLKNCSAILQDKDKSASDDLEWVSEDLVITENDMVRVIELVERYGK